MTPRALTDEVKRRAREAGFDLVGVARAEPLERDGAALAAWLAGGLEAGMVWMTRHTDKRSDPAVLLPGCRSVIALAMNYWPGDAEGTAAMDPARVAAYARGRDYHKVLGRRSRALAAWLAGETGLPGRAFVDTGPVLERAWSERAGIGWIGKNANLIHPTLGSWLLLAEILTVAELEPDPGPHADHCGTCNACIEACPTGAITSPGVVDSRRCISYWTIEHRGVVPPEVRAGNGDWIFGCDDCQTACPWNGRFAARREDDVFAWRRDLWGLDPAEVLSLDEVAFRARYSGTSLMRAKWEGIRRNACIVLGNRGDAAAAGVLARVLADGDPVVRGHAAWALGRLREGAGRPALERAAAGETDPGVRREIEAALGND